MKKYVGISSLERFLEKIKQYIDRNKKEEKVLLYSGELSSGSTQLLKNVNNFEKVYVIANIGGGNKVLEIFVDDFKNTPGVIWQQINETYQVVENNNVITICNHMHFNLYGNSITISANESFKNNSKLYTTSIKIIKIYGIAKENV